MKPARLLIHPPAAATWNMAVDQALLDQTAETGIGCLRFYRWNRPTLTLGYFQKTRTRFQHDPSSRLKLVRRSTGGGAIIHHHDWTYSVTIPESHLPDQENIELYHLVHDSVVSFLRNHGLHAKKYSPQDPLQEAAQDDKSFLCFRRRTEGDVVLYSADQTQRTQPEFGSKILGSAQRKRNGTILQHGSVLLGQSEFAPELPGVREYGVDLSDMKWDFENHLITNLEAKLGWELLPSDLSEVEHQAAEQWLESSFANPTWNQRS